MNYLTHMSLLHLFQYFRRQEVYTNTFYFTDGYSQGTEEHKLQTLGHVAAAVKTEFADLTKKLEAELEKYAVKEKEGWVKFDKLEEECKNLTKQVEKSAENLVRQLIVFATLGLHHGQSILLD